MLEPSDAPFAAHVATDEPVLDGACLNQLRALDPSGSGAFLKKVLETYLRSLDKQVGGAELARQEQRMDDLSRAAHSLKSASASVGALRFSRLCERIEHALRRGDTGTLDNDMAEFLAESHRVRRSVTELLGSSTA